MDSEPLLSIVCPSYNHGHYVVSFIESLKAQGESRWELIIIDDASTDDNLAKIRTVTDSRVRVIARDYNHGVTAGMNEGVRLARADLVAFIASDDLAHPCYVERVLAAFKATPAAVAVYVELDRMGPDGVSLNEPCRLPVLATRLEILRNSYLGQNQLPSPGMAIRRKALSDLLLPEGIVQYSDWMLQNRILMAGDIVMLEEQLVRYRVSPYSLSARSLGSMARDLLEARILMDDFLKIQDMGFLAQVFPVEMKPYAGMSLRHLPYVLGRLALLSGIPEKRAWGYETIMGHLSEAGVAESLHVQKGFTHNDLMALAPTENAALVDEVRRLRRSLRHLRRLAVALVALILAALWFILR